MAIRNKDGSVFRLDAPPPIMEEQIFWNEKIKIQNKFGQRHEQADVKAESFELPKKTEEAKEEIKIVDSVKEEAPKHINESIINVWCLPCVKYAEKVDELYGDSYVRPEYGKKFIFKAKLLQVEDFYIRLLTNEKLTERSVIYPQVNMKRWWRVNGVVEKDGFYFVSGVISDYQPSFS